MGWFANMLFGKTANQVQGPKPKEHSVWDVDDEGVPNVGEQHIEVPEHDAVPPEIQCRGVEPHVSSDGKQLELWIRFTNTFDGEIEMTRIECLGQTTIPTRFLKPGENHEVRVYRGPVFKDDAENKAQVTYKSTKSGDYYRAEYLIKYKYSQHEGLEHYTPYEFELIKPINQI